MQNLPHGDASRKSVAVVIETWFVDVDVVRPRCSRTVSSLHTAPLRPPGARRQAGTTAREPRPPLANGVACTQITDEFEPSLWSGRSRGVVGGGKSPHARNAAYGLRRDAQTLAHEDHRIPPPSHPTRRSGCRDYNFFFHAFPTP